NSWPSLHIVQSTQVVLILRYWYPPTTSRLQILHGILLVMWILLVISTMVIKQHYIWDVATALLLTGLGWMYWMKPCLERLKTQEFQDDFDARMAVD
ncbi:MAG: phosphatase PAP2 family protein, partial [Euryarchaeota archaeon]|nr:phosphatase PAP2 family protein [Euryarchaeota archaeon]